MGFWTRPRATQVWKGAFWLHQVLGLGIGALFVVLGLTGAALVYQTEVRSYLEPGFGPLPERTVQAPLLAAKTGAEEMPFHPVVAGQGVSLDSMKQAALAQHPGWLVTGFPVPKEGWPLVFRAKSPEGHFHMLAMDPRTGELLGEAPYDNGVWGFLSSLHEDWLLGDAGEAFNGVLGALCALLCLSGVVIWWPGVRFWRMALSIRKNSGLFQMAFDAHRFFGALAAFFLAIQGLTGVYFCYSEEIQHFTARYILGEKNPDSILSGAPKLNGKGDFLKLDDQVKNGFAVFPEGQLVRVNFAQKKGAAVRMAFFNPGDFSLRGTNYAYIDPVSGQVVKKWEVQKAQAPLRWLSAASAWHFGLAAGEKTRPFYVLLGLMPGFFFLTGFWMWWRRVVKPKAKKAEA